MFWSRWLLFCVWWNCATGAIPVHYMFWYPAVAQILTHSFGKFDFEPISGFKHKCGTRAEFGLQIEARLQLWLNQLFVAVSVWPQTSCTCYGFKKAGLNFHYWTSPSVNDCPLHYAVISTTWLSARYIRLIGFSTLICCCTSLFFYWTGS